MAPRTRSEDSDPVLEISAIGTADSNGDYLQHEAVALHKARTASVDPSTVVVRNESPQVSDAHRGKHTASSSTLMYPEDEEVTSVTKARLRAKGWGWFRMVSVIENHRAAALMLAVGGVMILVAVHLALK